MKGVRLLIFVFGILFFVTIVSALTTVNIKTLPYQDLFVTPVKIGTSFEALASPQFFSADNSGNLKLEFEDFSVSNFEIYLSLKDSEGNTIHRERSSENFVTGTEIYLIAAPDGIGLAFDNESEEVVNLTKESNDSLVEVSNFSSNVSMNRTTGLSGEAVGESKVGFSMQKFIFTLAGLVLLVIVYLVVREEASKGAFKNFGRGLSFDSGRSNSLERTKEDLKDAKEKVKALEKKERLEEVKARLKKDEEALERLEREQDEIIKKKRK